MFLRDHRRGKWPRRALVVLARRPDAIVTEARLPHLDGYELCRVVRGIDNVAHTPVLFVTADGFQQDLERATAAGATAVLVSLVATGTTTNIGAFMAIYRNGIPWPGTSNINWSGPGETIAVTTLTAVDNQARANVYAGSVTDVVIDVLGYYL